MWKNVSIAHYTLKTRELPGGRGIQQKALVNPCSASMLEIKALCWTERRVESMVSDGIRGEHD
jgi:hypothetical protein